MNLREDCIEIKCYNEDEWIQIQEYLFSIGIRWPTGIEIQYTPYGMYPRYLYLNYIDEYLCWDSYSEEDGWNSYSEDKRIKFHTNASVILRKFKLKKIDGR